MRLFSRAYIIRDKSKSIIFVSVDIAMISQIIKTSVSKKISKSYNGIYNVKNIALSATHTHSGPGGYHQYVLFSLTSLGFIKQSFDAIVDGIVLVSAISDVFRQIFIKCTLFFRVFIVHTKIFNKELYL